jgi:hypothetical protein
VSNVSTKTIPTTQPPLSKADQKERDIDSAMAQYRASQEEVRLRTAKLRALRLAQEAQETRNGDAAPAQPPAAPKRRTPRKKVTPTQS